MQKNVLKSFDESNQNFYKKFDETSQKFLQIMVFIIKNFLLCKFSNFRKF